MATTYNQPVRHYLQPTAGFDLMAHLNFVSPMAKGAIEFNNGSGWEPGVPAGSCMHLNENGALETGIEETDMPLFLLYNSWDSDAYMGCLTADKTEITSISMNSAVGDSSMPARQGYYNYLAGNYVDTTGLQNNTIPGGGAGSASNAPSNWSLAGGMKIKRPEQKGAYTTWPGSCGMELSTTEFLHFNPDGSVLPYAPNETLTSPIGIAETDPNWATAQRPANDPEQVRRGGYLVQGDVYADPICGVVSRGRKRNENGVDVLYFWACYLPADTRE